MDDRQREEYKRIGARIREVRRKQHLSQAELSERARVSLSQISDIETGKNTLLLSTFIRITEALQVSADTLLRADTPAVVELYKGEFTEILDDCTPSEIESILLIVKEIKKQLHKSED